ncbi:MAG TPA: DUF72 domain-containing protein [Polyangiaceae bacterium]
MPLKRPPRVRVGISGWTYPPWRGVFYPPHLKHAAELAFASRVFGSIELNGSFYSLQRPSSYAAWYQATPADFVFSVKGGRFITHLKQLRDVDTALANFFASGLLNLREKLGPILWQLPPRLSFDADRLERFLELLPYDLAGVERLARRHDQRLIGRAAVDAQEPNRPVQHTIEVRHPSFVHEQFLQLLQRHGVAICVADSAGLYPTIDEVTAEFAYVRLHGSERLYVSGYDSDELGAWAARARAWLSRGLDVYVYFDNDVKVRAPFDALNLRRVLHGLPVHEPPPTLARVTEEPRTAWVQWNGRGLRRRA